MSIDVDDDIDARHNNCFICKKCEYYIYKNFITQSDENEDRGVYSYWYHCPECKTEGFYQYVQPFHGTHFLGIKLPWRVVRHKQMIQQEIIAVEPMAIPDGLLFYLDYAFGKIK